MARSFYPDGGQFVATCDRADEAGQAVVKALEGRHWDARRRAWLLPANPRTFGALRGAGFVTAPSYGPALRQLEAAWKRPVLFSDTPLTLGARTAFPYQAAGVDWLSRQTHALLHDEQGTGKTFHAVAWGQEASDVIVVAPGILIPQWVSELALCSVSLQPSITKLPKRASDYSRDLRVKTQPGWVLVSPERLKYLDIPQKPFTFIIDEGIYFKNPKAQRTVEAMSWAARAERVLILNGSPVVNRPMDLWTTYLMLKQRTRKDFWKWAEHYCGSYQTPYGWDMTGATNLDDLKLDMLSFALRRERKDVLPWLPDKLRRTIRVPEDSLALSLINARAEEMWEVAKVGGSLNSGDGFMCLQNLRVETAISKVAYAAEWVTERVLQDETPPNKVVLFSEFKQPLRRVAALYEEETRGLAGAVLVTGDETPDERQEGIVRFQQDPACRLLLATYAVGARGLNLQVANTVVFLDLPWTPLMLEQAEDRVMRIGQERKLEVVTLLSGHPVEDLMLDTLERKQDIIDGLSLLKSRKDFVL